MHGITSQCRGSAQGRWEQRVVGSAAADLTAMRLLSGSQAVPHWQSENPCRLPQLSGSNGLREL